MRGRFAPSPTGDLHLGGARTALGAWLCARKNHGRFVLRIEDLDRPRVVPGAAERIVADLAALGLAWDEGPVHGGPHAPYFQSERDHLYRAAIARLDDAGLIYPCYCSRAEVLRALLESPSAPHVDDGAGGAATEGPRYPGTCRSLSRHDVAMHERAGRRASLRVRVPLQNTGGEIEFVDGIHGFRSDDVSRDCGDFVVRRADGLHAYQLAVVVDDAAMDITDVVRGDDLLSSTARQIFLYRALGANVPRFAHLPLVLGPDGKRLSKRHGSVAVRALLERGIAPERIIALLARSLLPSPASEKELREATPADLVETFSLTAIDKQPVMIDPASLDDELTF